MPLAVSVVIPTYNRAHLVGRAVRSVLAAARPDDEILVVDDGSTDNTAEAMAAFGAPVRYLPRPHAGAGATRNFGIRAATRPLVAFLDSDDEWDADKLGLHRAFHAARPEVVMSFTDFRGIDGAGKIHPRYLAVWRGEDQRPWEQVLGPSVPFSCLAGPPAARPDFAVHVGDMYAPLMASFFMAAFTLVVRRELAGDELRYNEDVLCYEDLECFARVARCGPAAYLDTETATQHGHIGPRLTDANADILTRARLTILGKVWGQDKAFLEREGPHFDRVVKQQHMTRAKWLLCQGRTREAREEMKQAGDCSLGMRLLAALPGPLAKGLLRVRRALRGRG